MQIMGIMGIMGIRVLFDLRLFGVFGGEMARWRGGGTLGSELVFHS
jgi:hypothetical protein